MNGEASPLRYSICATVFNESGSIRKSLDSILCQVDSDFEIVIVDSESTDGTSEILAEAASKHPSVKVVERKCSRGRGRQIAFENSIGHYIIANMDMDDLFEPRLRDLLELYHRHCEGNLLWARSLTDDQQERRVEPGDQHREWGGGIVIGPRSLIEQLGGWRNLQRFEDVELAARAARSGRYKWCFYRIIKEKGSRNEKVSLWGTVLDRVANLLIRSRKGQSFTRTITTKQKIALPFAYACFFPYFRLRKPYRLFDPREIRYCIQLT